MLKMIIPLLVSLACITDVAAVPTDDVFTTMAGLNGTLMPSASYSGYLKVTETKSLHYVFVESMRNTSATDPVVIWFNGGPGCSSMLGFLQENGPFVMDDGENWLKENPFPWNKNVSMLYIESPAGVGFSKATGPNDFSHSDMSQSNDAFVALKDFYSKFPEFKNNSLYVSGESYAGIYVPYLAWQIYENNNQAKFDTALDTYNLKGFIVGNGATDWDYDVFASTPDTFYGFSMVPMSIYDQYKANYCVQAFNGMRPTNGTDPALCDTLWGNMSALIHPLNWYDLYRKQYPETSLLSDEDRMETVMIGGVAKTYKKGYTMQEYSRFKFDINNFFNKAYQPDVNQVLNTAIDTLVNSPEMRTDLHIPDDIQAFEQCTKNPNFTYHYQ